MAKFKSEIPNLVLQDDEGVWARFADGEFETDDKDAASRLRKVEGVSEADDEREMTVKELQDEIARRNEGRDEAEQIKPESQKKADLQAALAADDEA